MAKQELTPWFKGYEKPSRVGYYERDWGDLNSVYDNDWWDGEQWLYDPDSGPAFHQRRRWRGLAKDPSTPTTDAPQAKGSEVDCGQ